MAIELSSPSTDVGITRSSNTSVGKGGGERSSKSEAPDASSFNSVLAECSAGDSTPVDGTVAPRADAEKSRQPVDAATNAQDGSQTPVMQPVAQNFVPPKTSRLTMDLALSRGSQPSSPINVRSDLTQINAPGGGDVKSEIGVTGLKVSPKMFVQEAVLSQTPGSQKAIDSPPLTPGAAGTPEFLAGTSLRGPLLGNTPIAPVESIKKDPTALSEHLQVSNLLEATLGGDSHTQSLAGFELPSELPRDKSGSQANNHAATGAPAVFGNLELPRSPLDVIPGPYASSDTQNLTDRNGDTYWISSDLKNATVHMDGLRDTPLEINISVHGNQAHLAFKTDESTTRTALEGASGALKDLLGREGIDLTGVSVGTNAHDNRQPGQQSTSDGPSPSRRPSSGGPVGQSPHVVRVQGTVGVDIFV